MRASAYTLRQLALARAEGGEQAELARALGHGDGERVVDERDGGDDDHAGEDGRQR